MARTIDPKLQAEIDALTALFMTARGGGEDFNVALPNLSPALLDFILQTEAQRDVSGNGMQRGFGSGTGEGNFHQYANYGLLGNSPESQAVSYDPNQVNWSQSPIQFGVSTDTSNYMANYDQQGRFTGYELAEDNNNWREAITAALMMAPAVAGVYGWAGGAVGEGGAAAGAGGTGGAGGAEALSGMDLAADAALGTGNNITTAGAGLSGTGAAGTSGVSEFRQGEIGSYQTNGSMPSSAATQGGNMTLLDQAKVALNGTTGTEGLLGSGGNMAGTGTGSTSGLNSGGLLGAGAQALTGGNGDVLGGLLGAYLGYQQSKDQQQTQNRDPWGPAQPYLKGLLQEGADLYGKYKAEPFSPAEQTAYGNLGGVYDTIFQGAGGLLQGFDVTASGGNQFERGKRKTLIGANFEPTAQTWNPGLLGDFGTASARKKVM